MRPRISTSTPPSWVAPNATVGAEPEDGGTRSGRQTGPAGGDVGYVRGQKTGSSFGSSLGTGYGGP